MVGMTPLVQARIRMLRWASELRETGRRAGPPELGYPLRKTLVGPGGLRIGETPVSAHEPRTGHPGDRRGELGIP